MTPSHTYLPAWWVPGPHLKTLWGRFFRRRARLPLRPERWTTPDDDFVDVHRLAAPPGRPQLLLLHGLEGSQRSHYVAGVFEEARRRGWAATLLVFRSCGPQMNHARRLYHSGETGDLDFAVRRLIAERPGDPLLLAGVSLGGNVLLKWLGEVGAQAPREVVAAATVSVPYDLARGSRYINQGFSQVYERHFLQSLRRKAHAKLAVYPDLVSGARLRAARTMWEFDDAVTSVVHGFADAADYYERSSSIRWLHAVRRPTLLLSAADDPFLPPAVLDDVRRLAAENPCLQPEFVARGGHVGFVSGRVPWRPFWYAEWRLVAFLASQLERGDGAEARPGPMTALVGEPA